jgi:glycosyltransferase involved in cell wall biosynthesis
MRVLQVGKYYPPARGGIETLVRNLSEGLRSAGESVTVVCSDTSRRGGDEWHDGVRVVRTATLATIFSQPLSPALPSRILSRSRDADVVHVHCPNPLAEVTALALPRRLPLVASWHSDIVSQRGLRRIYEPASRAFLRRVDAIVVATPHHVRYSSLLPEYSAKCAVIPYGIAPPPPAPQADLREVHARYGPEYLLFVGRLVRYKGVHVLLSALRNLPNATLVVAGDGPLRGELVEQANREGVGGRTHFLGAVGEQRLAELYRGCAVFVLPSVTRAEAFGLVLAEAMSYGKPAVSTRLDSGVTLVNLDGVTGRVVEPNDVNDLARALASLLAAPEERARLGAQAQLRFQEHFSRDALVTRMRELYAELVNHGRASPNAIST